MPSAMIALFLPEDIAQQIAIPGGEPAEELHLTLLFLGEDFSEAKTNRVVTTLAAFAEGQPDIAGLLNGFARFTEAEPNPFVLVFDSPDLNEVQAELTHLLEMNEIDYARDHGFTPHITLAFLGPDDDPPFEEFEPVDVTFPQVTLVVGDNSWDFPLRHPVEPPETVPTYHLSMGAIRCSVCTFDRWDWCTRHEFTNSDTWVCDDFADAYAVELEQQMAVAECAGKAVTPFANLPLAARGRAWDASAARKRITKWAGGPDKGDVDWKKYKKAHLFFDPSNQKAYGGYKFAFADVVDGRLMAVPRGIFAASSRLMGSKIPSGDKKNIKAHVGRYYKAMAEKFKDDTLVSPFSVSTNGKAGSDDGRNALALLEETDDELIVGNHIVLWGDSGQRDLEGLLSPRRNKDGTLGEYFTQGTEFESVFTKSIGRMPVDWEHRRDKSGPGDQVLGYVDWKSAVADSLGIWVQRVLDRRNKYIHILHQLGWFAKGMIGSSSEPINALVAKAADGEILVWPLRGDTLTVMPMDPRHLVGADEALVKALGLEIPIITNPGEGGEDLIDVTALLARLEMQRHWTQ